MGRILVVLLVLVTAATALADPRRLRVGVYLAVALGLALVGLAGRLVVAFGVGADDVQVAWVILGVVALALVSLLALGLFSVANGVTMVRREGRRPANLLSLGFGLGVLAYGGLILVFWIEDREQTDLAFDLFWVLVTVGLPLMYLAFVFVVFVGYGLLYGWVVKRWARPVDVVVVLGAGLRGEDVTPLLAGRLHRGREVLERSRARGRDTHVICSGGQGPDEVVPEAVAMADHLAREGVHRAWIWLEDRSTSTEENLAFSREVARRHGVDDCRFAVVTSDFHVFRAALLMRKVGLAGYATGARTARYFWPSAILREYAAVLRDHRWLNGAILAVLCLPLLTFLLRLLPA